MNKVTVIGAGNVGATVANVLAHKDFLSEVIVLDIKEGTAEGKSLDSWQQAPIDYYSTRIKGLPMTMPPLPVQMLWSSHQDFRGSPE